MLSSHFHWFFSESGIQKKNHQEVQYGITGLAAEWHAGTASLTGGWCSIPRLLFSAFSPNQSPYDWSSCGGSDKQSTSPRVQNETWISKHCSCSSLKKQCPFWKRREQMKWKSSQNLGLLSIGPSNSGLGMEIRWTSERPKNDSWGLISF